MSKNNIKVMNQLAKQRRGICLSKRYVNSKTKLQWQCDKGHIWKTIAGVIKQGHWCPKCASLEQAKKRKLSIKDMINLAKRKKGKCISKIYVNSHSPLKWQCGKGHIWKTDPINIIMGRWCPRCANNKKRNIADMRKLAKEKGGKCLSREYINNKTKLKWQCKEGHVWSAKPNRIVSGTWCAICAKKAKHTVRQMQVLAKKKKGKCLSNLYINTKTKLKWQCKDGHIWYASPGLILRGAWCPICSVGISERICCKYFENLFGEKFPKKKPIWLINSKGNQMELDGYCEKLKLAFEYQGIQHYKFNKRFHGNTILFKQRKEDDKLKKDLCRKHDVTLIDIPYNIKYGGMGRYIYKKCLSFGIKVQKPVNRRNYDSLDAFSPGKLKEVEKVAKLKGGKCLSNHYVDSTTKLKWQCSKGHIWEAIPISIKRGSWCPFCIGKHQTVKEMQKLAKSKGGKCLSKKYLKSHRKLVWQCEYGHTLEARPAHIKRGSWCPYCAGRVKPNLEEIKSLAISKGGKLLSTTYKNNRTKLKWKCAEGHIWETALSNVKSGKWCPYCAIKKVADSHRLSIDDMRRVAKSKEGKCLSKEYINSQMKLKWQCKAGHVWFARPAKIKFGQWCPQCSSKKLTMEDMKKLAEQKQGECLSKSYTNNYTKLKWQCKSGHVWTATPHNIKNSTWCPICGRIFNNRK